MKKTRFLSVCAVLLLCFFLLPAAQAASSFRDEGVCGSHLTYSLSRNGILTVSGRGAMTRFDAPESVPWYETRAYIKRVDIENGVSTVSAFAFADCPALTAVNLGSDVIAIGRNAFRDCPSLAAFTVAPAARAYSSADGVLFDKAMTVLLRYPGAKAAEAYTVPASVERLADGAFSSASYLSSVALPDGLAAVGTRAFADCTGLKEIALPKSVVFLGDHAFAGCAALKAATLPDSLTAVPYGTFLDCRALTHFSLPADAVSVGRDAFARCSSLITVGSSNTLETVGDSAFYACSSLVAADFPDTVTSVGAHAFHGCMRLRRISASGVYSLGAYAFADCLRLKDVTLSDDLTVLPENAFSGCTALEQFDFPSALERIEDRAFFGCSSLAAARLPETLSAVGRFAFAGCASLATVEVSPSLAAVGIDAFGGTAWQNNALGGIAYASDILCRVAKAPADGFFRTKESTTALAPAALYGLKGLKTAVVTEGVKTIGDLAFYGCSDLTDIVIAESVAEIGLSAFADCPNLIIRGVRGSTAETYAAENGIPFLPLALDPCTLALTGQVRYTKGAYTLPLRVRNERPKTVRATVVTALYKDSRLTAVDVDTLSLPPLDAEAFTFTVRAEAGCDAKVFLLDADLAPLASPVAA